MLQRRGLQRNSALPINLLRSQEDRKAGKQRANFKLPVHGPGLEHYIARRIPCETNVILIAFLLKRFAYLMTAL